MRNSGKNHIAFKSFLPIIALLLTVSFSVSNAYAQKTDLYLNDCFNLINDGKFGLSKEKFTIFLEKYSDNPRETYLRGLQVTLMEWLACERYKLNSFVFSESNSATIGERDITDLPDEIGTFVDTALYIEKLKERNSNYKLPVTSTSGIQSGDYPPNSPFAPKTPDLNPSSYMSNGNGNNKSAWTDIEEIFNSYLDLPGVVSEHAETAYQLMLYGNKDVEGLISISNAIVKFDKLIYQAKRIRDQENREFGDAITRGSFNSGNHTKKEWDDWNDYGYPSLNEQKNKTYSKYTQIIENLSKERKRLLDMRQILNIEVELSDTEKKLYEWIYDLYWVQSASSGFVKTDNISLDLLRQAIKETSKRGRKALRHVREMGFDDMVKLFKIERLRILVANRIGVKYAVMESIIAEDIEDFEKTEGIIKLIATVGGSILAVGGIIFPPLFLAGTIILTGVATYDLCDAIVVNSDTWRYINVGVDQGVNTIAEGEKALSDLTGAIVQEGIAIIFAGLAVGQAVALTKSNAYFIVRHKDTLKNIFGRARNIVRRNSNKGIGSATEGSQVSSESISGTTNTSSEVIANSADDAAGGVSKTKPQKTRSEKTITVEEAMRSKRSLQDIERVIVQWGDNSDNVVFHWGREINVRDMVSAQAITDEQWARLANTAYQNKLGHALYVSTDPASFTKLGSSHRLMLVYFSPEARLINLFKDSVKRIVLESGLGQNLKALRPFEINEIPLKGQSIGFLRNQLDVSLFKYGKTWIAVKDQYAAKVFIDDPMEIYTIFHKLAESRPNLIPSMRKAYKRMLEYCDLPPLEF